MLEQHNRFGFKNDHGEWREFSYRKRKRKMTSFLLLIAQLGNACVNGAFQVDTNDACVNTAFQVDTIDACVYATFQVCKIR